MSIYDYIFEFIRDNIFSSSYLSGLTFNVGSNSMTMNIWLSHTLSVVCMVLIAVVLILFVRWIFRIVSGLFLLRR